MCLAPAEHSWPSERDHLTEGSDRQSLTCLNAAAFMPVGAGKAFAAEAEAVAPAFDANFANGRVQYKCYTARASYQTFPSS